MPLLGLAALLLAVLVLLAWILAELRGHAAGGRRLGRTVEQLLEPERVTLEEIAFPSRTCNLCGGPIGKRLESDRMWTGSGAVASSTTIAHAGILGLLRRRSDLQRKNLQALQPLLTCQE